MNKTSRKNSAFLHILTATIILFLLDVAVKYSLRVLYFKALIPFNTLNSLLKIIILLLGGYLIFVYVFDFIQRIVTLIGGHIINKFGKTLLSEVIVNGIAILNSIYLIVWFWTIPAHYDFFIVVEFLTVSATIWQLMRIVLPVKEQSELNTKEDEIVNRF